MKKRNPGAVLLLPIVTLGIYAVYWLYATRKELLAHDPDKTHKIPPVFILFIPIILLIFAVIGLLIASAGDETVAKAVFIGFMLLLILTISLLPLWWFWRYCQAAAAVTKSLDFNQAYVLYVILVWLLGLAPVWMLIMQMEFNKLAARQHPHPAAQRRHA